MRTFDLDTNVNTRISKADKQRLADVARCRGVTLSDLVREHIRQLVSQAA
jgi:hypothetical protein